MTSRFASLTEQDIEKMVEGKESQNTKICRQIGNKNDTQNFVVLKTLLRFENCSSSHCLLSSWSRFNVFVSSHPSFHRTVFFGATVAFSSWRRYGLMSSLRHFHVFVSSYLVTLSPCYPVTLLPCYLVTLLPCYPVTLLSSYPVTLLPFYPVTLLPCYPVTLLPCYPVTLFPCYLDTFLPCYPVTLLPCCPFTLLPC